MAKILILYSTTDGHTVEICKRLKTIIENQSDAVTIESIDEFEANLEGFDKVVIGASIRYGKHKPQVFEFIKRNQPVLDSMPNAFFSVNVVARKPEKNQPDTNPYLIKFLKQITWKPEKLAVFAGRLDYPSYSFWDRQMIRLIMLITKGPTHPKTVIEYTDWNQVEEFGKVISEM